ncbi:MAG: HutP family protein, partial [Peptostreptococcales bacterium]
GAIAGAAKDAIMQIAVKSSGLNGGGKIGICRHKEHLSVCIFMSIGLLHLNEVVIGLGHRSIPYNE